MFKISTQGSRKCFINLALAGITFIVALFVGELIFRWYFDIGLTRMPWFYHVNALQFRYGNSPALSVDRKAKSIMILGDSYTFGYGVDYEATYPVLLEKRFEEYSDDPVKVLNFSRLGWNTRAETEFFFRKGHDWQFDALILSFTFNDVEFDPIIVEHPDLFCAVTQMTMLHSLVYVLYQVKQSFAYGVRDYGTTLLSFYRNKRSQEWIQLDSCIKRLNQYCRERGKGFFIFYFELFCDKPGIMRYEIRQEMAKFANENKIPFVDIKPVLDCDLGKYYLYKFNEHPNAAAHRMAADAIITYLKERNLR